MEFSHKPVLLYEAVESLRVRPEGTYVDGTLGGGGHAFEVVRRLKGKGRFAGIDKDDAAIKAAGARLGGFMERVTIIRGSYRDMKPLLHEIGIDEADGILLDLGVSSYQFDEPERGFSYRYDAPLDMRMDRRAPFTARDVVNGYGEKELIRVIYEYGEERYAANIARMICLRREKAPINTTGELSDIVLKAVPAKYRRLAGHPAKKTFQAIRIEVNGELRDLSESLDDMIELLSDGGRLCVITFHSLEDRIVKDIFRRNENPCTCPPSFPVCVCGKKSKGRVLTAKPVLPSPEETAVNPRAAGAKLRVFERRKL